MATVPGQIKECDDATRNLVFGFVRIIQQKVDQIIPIHIINICVSFYFMIEGFLQCGNKYIEISDDGKTITNKGPTNVDCWDTAYGQFEIDCDDEYNENYIFEWIFYIHCYAQNCCSIGIDETKRKWINECCESVKGTVHYNLRCDGTLYSCNGTDLVRKYGGTYKDGDTIIMQLDIGQRTLIFYKIEKSKETQEDIRKEVDKNTDIIVEGVKYCIACYLWRHGCFELKSFDTIKKE